jgi:hypothetical protein
MSEKDRFLYPHHSYHGEFAPETVVFDANLQEFAQKIGYICSLENSGKVEPDEAYRQIKALYKQLKASKRELGIGEGDNGKGTHTE